MTDYLNKLCEELKIQLIYTEDSPSALSTGVNNNGPYVKANRILKNCPEEVARAVIDYYASSQYEYKSLKILTDYLMDNTVTVEFVINPPDETFKELLIGKPQSKVSSKSKPPKSTPHKRKASGSKTAEVRTSKSSTSKKKASEDDTSSFVELNIASINQKDFWNNSSQIKPDDAITASSDDVVELDVVVDDSILQ